MCCCSLPGRVLAGGLCLSLLLHTIQALAAPAPVRRSEWRTAQPRWHKVREGPLRTRHQSGWREGPFLALGAGVVNADHDYNILTNEQFGGKHLLGYVLNAGWNLTDRLGAETQLRFAHGEAVFDGQKEDEWVWTAGLSAKFAPFEGRRVHSPRAHVVPYLKGGALVYVLLVPGRADRNESKVGAFGPGVNAGGGVEFLFGDHPRFMIDLGVETHLVFLEGKQVKITEGGRDVGSVTVTNSGFDPQLSAAATMGVQF